MILNMKRGMIRLVRKIVDRYSSMYTVVQTIWLVSSEHTINLKARHWKRENIVHVLVWAASKGKKWQKLFRQLHYCFSGPEPFSRQLLLVPEVSRKIEMIIIIAWEMTNSYFLPLSICTWFLTFYSWNWYFSLFEISSLKLCKCGSF